MLTGSNDIRSKFFVDGPIAILAAVAASTAVIEIIVITHQVRETRNPLGPIVINAKVEIWRAAIRLTAVHTDPCKLTLQKALITSVVFELPGRELTMVSGLWILK